MRNLKLRHGETFKDIKTCFKGLDKLNSVGNKSTLRPILPSFLELSPQRPAKPNAPLRILSIGAYNFFCPPRPRAPLTIDYTAGCTFCFPSARPTIPPASPSASGIAFCYPAALRAPFTIPLTPSLIGSFAGESAFIGTAFAAPFSIWRADALKTMSPRSNRTNIWDTVNDLMIIFST